MKNLAFFTLVWCAIVAPVGAATYRIVDLGTHGGATSFALDVNNLRQVTGNAQEPLAEPAPRLNAFLWTPPGGPMANLGVLPGSNNFSRGYAINDLGAIVGESDNDSSRAFVTSGGVMSGLTRLAGDNDRGVAHGINNAGAIVGVSGNGTSNRPTQWTHNGSEYAPSDLGTIAGTPSSTGRAWAINENGASAGLSTSSSGVSQATLWNGGVVTNLTSLGDGNQFSQGLALNDLNVVVGSSFTGQTVGQLIGTGSTTAITRAFRWEASAIAELTPFNLYTPQNNDATANYHSAAMDVNNAGLIVGNSQRIAGSAAVATLWRNGQPIDLNSLIPAGSGWNLLSAEGINEAGDIVGFGTFNGATRAFLLTVPEPGSAMLGGFGLAAVLLTCRRTTS